MANQADLSIRQFVAAWNVLCAAAPDYAAHSEDGVEYVFSGVPLPFFNAAVLTGGNLTDDELQASAGNASAWASDRAVPWILITTQERDATAALDACGFAPLMGLTGMLAGQVASKAQTPADLDLLVPQDDAGCMSILDVNSAAYGMSFEAGSPVWGVSSFWKDHTPVLGLAKGQPVSSTAVMVVDGHHYVALVATAPGMQRRGYADAAMRRALEVSREKHGELPTFLHATDAGRPVYERMGYESVASHTIFIEKKFLGGH